MKTHYKTLMNRDYIGSYSLQTPEGFIEKVVEIVSVEQKEVTGPNNQKEMKMVAQLKNEKPFIVNVTNAESIATVAGSEFIEDWTGTKITLYVAQIRAFGENHNALRVRDVAPGKPELKQGTPTFEKAKKAIESKSATIEQIKKKYEVSADVEKLLNGKK